MAKMLAVQNNYSNMEAAVRVAKKKHRLESVDIENVIKFNKLMFRAFEKYEGIMTLGVLYFFSLFSTQNHVPQITLGMNQAMCHIKALSTVILTTLKKFRKNFPGSEKKRFKNLSFNTVSSE